MSSSANIVAEPESPITLDRFNLRPSRRKVRETFFGKIRAFDTFTVLEWTYLGFSFVGLAASLGLTIERMVTGGTNTSDFTFAILLMLTIVFCFYYVVDAVLTERADELMVFVISNFIVLIYCIANYASQTKSTVKLVRLAVVCVLSTLLIPTGLYQSYKYLLSNNLVYNTVGGVTELQKACKMYYLCSSLLKFDLQLQLSMLILVMGATGTSMDQTQKFILGYGVVFTIIFLVTGFVGLRQENRILMIVFYVLSLCEPGYVAYKFHYAAVHDADAATYESTFACGCFAIVVWIALIFFTGYYTKFYFYKGLKEKMFNHPQDTVPKQAPNDSSAGEDIGDLSSSSTMQKSFDHLFPSSLTSVSTSSTAALNVVSSEVHSGD